MTVVDFFPTGGTKRRNTSVSFAADTQGSSAISGGTSRERSPARANANDDGDDLPATHDSESGSDGEDGDEFDDDGEDEEGDEFDDAQELKRVASIGRRHTP
jgi:hypothetical protein